MKNRPNPFYRYLLCLVLLVLTTPLAAQTNEDLILVNIHYVDSEQLFTGVDVSFFVMSNFYSAGGQARVEAYAATPILGGLDLEPRGTWDLTLDQGDVTLPGERGFFLPHNPMILKQLDVASPAPFGTSILVTALILDPREIAEGHIFPNVRYSGSAAAASLVALADGSYTPGLTVEQLLALVSEPDPDGSLMEFVDGVASPDGGAGTHVMVHTQPRMMPP